MVTPSLRGCTFGLLTVLRQSPQPPGRWICQCQCGNQTEASYHRLTTGRTQSCGCQPRRARLTPKQAQRISKILDRYRNPPKKPTGPTLTEIARQEDVAYCTLRNRTAAGHSVEATITYCRERGLTYTERATSRGATPRGQLPPVGKGHRRTRIHTHEN